MAGSPLSHNADIVMGQSPSRDECNTDGLGLPLLNGPTEFGAHHPTPVQFTTDPRKRANQGDILFCVRGSTTGRMNWADREYAIGRGIAAIRHKNRPELQPLVRAVIEFGLPSLLAEATGSTFPNVSSDQLSNLLWPALGDSEQRAIAHILGTLGDKIELNRWMNETLEAMARALFKSWFVDFDPVRAKAEGRDPGLPKHIADLFPDSFEESELGEVPKGWKISTLRELASDIQYGLTQSAAKEQIGPNFLRITDIQGGKIDWGTVPFCKVTLEEHERYRLQPGDILVARTGASTGENTYLPSAPDAVFASYLVRFQFSDLAMARLVGAFMRTQAYFDYVSGCIGGSAQPNASAQALAGAQLIVPSGKIARKFANIVGPLDSRIVANNNLARTITTLRDKLLPKLISGEIRLAGP